MADADDKLASDAALDKTLGLPVTLSPGTPVSTVGRSFAKGELVAERYRVARLIGEGGMGEVYEAQDLLLRESVALKLVRHDVAGDEKVVERFKREIQLARKVTHRNVCRIFDVGLHRVAGSRIDLAFLSMELLEGQTLAARIARAGRFSLAEAEPLVAQMAAALDAAHQAGIVHRDFKSANVMLVDSPRGVRAVVTDFGLALSKQAATDPSITGDGGVVGSPSYMAPEQVEGKEVTAAADLYALGVVLYEMVTGRLPFVGDTPLSTAVKRLREEPLTPCAHVTGLDPRWEAAILHCLRREPGRRPRSARAVADELAAPAPRWFSGWRRRAAIGATAATLLTAGVVRFARPWEKETPAAAVAPREETSRRAVAVLGFKNLTNRAEASWIAGALTEMIATELSAGDDVRIISGESVARAKRELELGDELGFARDTLAKLRHVLDADYVLTGSYYMTSGNGGDSMLRVDLKLVDTRTGEPAAVLTTTGVEADLVALVERTGQTLRSRLSLADLSPAEREAARASQPRPDVARLYAEGLAQLRVAACSAARAPLEQAVATDPNFPLARSALAEALQCLGHDARALSEAKKAAELAANLPEQIRLVTEAKLFQISRQPEKALEAYARLFARFPDNFDYGYQVASLQLWLMREKELPQTLAALRALPPPAGNNPRIDLLESYAEQMAGRPASALEKIQRARAHAEELGLRLVAADAQLVEAKVLLQLRREDEALATVDRARVIYEAANDLDGIAKTLAVDAAVREGRGDREGALRAERQVESIAKNLESPRQMLQFKHVLGVRLASQGRVETALRAFDDAAEIAKSVGDDDSRAISATMGAAMLLLSGDLGGAEQRLLGAPSDGINKDLRAGTIAWLAMVRSAKDDASGSRARLDEAEALASRAGKAQVMLVRAHLALEEDRFAEADRMSREIIDSSPTLAPSARFVLAATLLEEGKVDDARKVVQEIESAQYKGEFAGELTVAILRARLRGASGAVPDMNDARKLLATAEAEAKGLGARLLALEARRAQAELELAHGDAQQGKVLYAALARDAAATGLSRMARKARERIQ